MSNISHKRLNESLEKVIESVTILVIVQLTQGQFMSILSFLKKTFSFDNRSMALYRVLLGLIVIADVIYRWPNIVNFYTDIGLVPRSIFISEMSMPWSLSFHLANGSELFITILFSLHLLMGFMLLVGFKSRWAIVGAFLFTVSTHNRNWLVNNGGDDVLRSILFFSMFLPLGRTFSIDAAMKKERNENQEFFSFWVLAFFLQAFVIYYVSYLLKDHPIWRQDFTAIFYSSRLDIFATKFGVWMRDYPRFMKLGTIFSIYLEWLGPLLLIGSYLFGRFWWVARTVIVLLFWSFHFGIFATMKIGLFPFIAMTMWSIFLPGPLWDNLASHFKARKFHELSLYYDGECGFCQKGVRLIREFFLFKEVTINVAQEYPIIFKEMEKSHSWVVVNEHGKIFTKFDAWIEIVKHSPFLYWSAGFFEWRPISLLGQKIYHWVSHHRPLMGKATQFLEYSSVKKEIFWIKWIRELTGAFFLIVLFAWNLTTIKKLNFKAPTLQNVARWTHIYQEWNMFAPYPKMDNVWIEIPAVLSDGSQIELLSGSRDPYSIKDKSFYRGIQSEHWRKFYLNVTEKADYARYYAGYLCRLWNERRMGSVPNVTLRKMEIIVYSQLNLADGDKGGITQKLTWKHWCFDDDYKKDNPNPKK